VRQVGPYLVWAFKSLRRVVPSKKLLLHGVIRDDNSANNGESSCLPCDSVLNHGQDRQELIPWEVPIKIVDPVTTSRTIARDSNFLVVIICRLLL